MKDITHSIKKIIRKVRSSSVASSKDGDNAMDSGNSERYSLIKTIVNPSHFHFLKVQDLNFLPSFHRPNLANGNY